jgi:alpha-glucoside transport system substrate-binding protein
MNKKKMALYLLFNIAISVVLLTACQLAEAPTEPYFEPTKSPTPTQSEPDTTPITSKGSYYDRALAGEFSGTAVTVVGSIMDEDAITFNNSVAKFEERTGIDIQHTGSIDFEAIIAGRIKIGDVADIMDIGQPGFLANFVNLGEVVDVSTYMDRDYLEEQYNPSLLQMATMEGPNGPIMAGVWHRVNIKSLVWYPKDDFEAAGYQIPTTWDEMVELSDTMVADGRTPWCIGIESDVATGWPATDWMEDIMLRTTSLENYDRWVQGELAFSSDEVKNAVEIMSDIFLNEDYVLGGRAGLVSTSFGDAATPMFDEPPRCWLHRQGNFITYFFPEGVQAMQDYDFFYLPPINATYGKPFLMVGNIFTQFNDRPEVRAVMEHFTRGESVKAWLTAGGTLSPHLDANLDWYGDEMDRSQAALIREATSFRFDGSDQMPGEVGAGSFWISITEYLSDAIDLDTALAQIDASWPR